MYVWSTLNHSNIVPFLGVVFDFDRPGTPCLVSPFYHHGDILKYMRNQPKANRFALVSCIFIKVILSSSLPQISQVVSALVYMHDRSIIHGDIKPVSLSTEPILVDSHQLQSNILINDKDEASLTNFGLSCVLETTGFTTMASGTLRYMAPQLHAICEEEEVNPSMTKGWRGKAPERMAVSVNEEQEFMPRVTKETDVWEIGMTVLEVCIWVSFSLSFAKLRKMASRSCREPNRSGI